MTATTGPASSAGRQDARPQRPDALARQDARRTEIVDIAAQMFASNGYDATGMAELCAAVGMGKGALYHYIGSKDNLLALIHERVMAEVTTDAERIVARNLPARERLLALGQSQVGIIARYPDHLRVFLHEYRALSPDNAERFRTRRRSFEKLVEATLRDGVASGEFEIADIKLAVLGWLGMHNYAYLWLGTSAKRSADVIARRFFEFFVQGIAGRSAPAT